MVELAIEPGTSWLVVRSSDHQATRLVILGSLKAENLMIILPNYKVWTMFAVRNKQVLAQKRKLLQYNSRKYVEKF